LSLSAEIDANYARFFEAWSAEATGNVAYSRGKEALLESHRRLAAFRALRVHVVETTLSDRAAAFFLEANNDLVTSHVCAHMCAWRAALKFLRSAVENTLSAFYFDVHPIELRLWEAGSFKLGFTTAMKFFGSHPDLAPLPDAVPGLAQIEKEYATLSKAVHASSRTFRMTEGDLSAFAGPTPRGCAAALKRSAVGPLPVQP
jgi:hypothetical protein